MDLERLVLEINRNKNVMERLLNQSEDNVQYMKGYIEALKDLEKYIRRGY